MARAALISVFPFCSGASAGARGASGTQPLREEVGMVGVRLEEGQVRGGGLGPGGRLGTGHS